MAFRPTEAAHWAANSDSGSITIIELLHTRLSRRLHVRAARRIQFTATAGAFSIVFFRTRGNHGTDSVGRIE